MVHKLCFGYGFRNAFSQSNEFYIYNHFLFSFLRQAIHIKPNPDPPPCWGGLLIFIWPVTALVSMIVQCFVTAWRVDHRARPRRRRLAHRARSTSRPRETREEARQRKYRYLYQVRTARGDIISQVGAGAQRSITTIVGSQN